jgi:putative hydrolases of HD superfamily
MPRKKEIEDMEGRTMTLSRLDRQLDFLRHIDQLKNVIRQSSLIDQSRKENTAEHSWHLGVYALVLAEYAQGSVDVSRVVRMLLIHDIVEIDAGDTPLNQPHDAAEQYEREHRGAQRIFGLLPPEQTQEFRMLWEEFEAAESTDAQFAKSLDRLQPLVHNVATGGGSWIPPKVSESQVEQRYGPPIKRGSPRLWDRAKEMVRQHFKKANSDQ